MSTSLSTPTPRSTTQPRQATPAPWRRVFGSWLTAYKRTWRGSIFGRFLSPVLFLLSMGLGLGGLVDKSAGGVGGVPYLNFVVPGILAAQAMWVAMGESSYPVMGAIRWNMKYHAMLATPVGIDDILLGHLTYVAMQITGATAIFIGVAALFGSFGSWWVLLCLPITVLTGMAFAVPVFAFSAKQESDGGFNILFRFIMTPLFLFSGVFFPIDQLPAVIRPIAWVMPLWHGVDANRSLALGSPDVAGVLGHTAYLVVAIVIGALLARRSFTKRLVV
ncbi:MAG TPA: ABC transporter permease [Dermatophilaceae bacterium]|nr:ABC transporter permease [Dermatophilaceae bacterium]